MAGGDSTGNMPDSGTGCITMLRKLGREEILEILSEGLCPHCDVALQKRIQILTERKLNDTLISNETVSESSTKSLSADLSSEKDTGSSSTTWGSARTPDSVFSGRGRTSTASKRLALKPSDYEILLNDGLSRRHSRVDDGMSEEQKEYLRFEQVCRKKDFSYYERINGRSTNVLKGLELHTRVFNAEEQKEIVECVYNLQRLGQKGQLRARTYSEPRKWMRGKGRVTLQFGCCYNYAVDKNGNPPGIIRDEEVDPLPPLFKQMIRRMVRWRILPPSCVPNSCIVNIYDEGDCIPPHIDHHDFVRPFCTVSFLTECNILFGSNLKILSPGEFEGPVSIPLPVGSVFILSGNGADVAKHCVPGVPSKRISITFRRMDESKLPYHYSHEPELKGIKPLNLSEPTKLFSTPAEQSETKKFRHERSQLLGKAISDTLVNNNKEDEFPPLGSANSRNRERRINRGNFTPKNGNGSGSGY